jgi:hypothetical protein
MTEKQKESGGDIHVLLGKVMAEIGAVGKDRDNLLQGWKFRGIDDLCNAVHPALVAHGVFVVPEILGDIHVDQVAYGIKGTMAFHVILKVAFHFSAPDGSTVTATMAGEAIDAGDKAANKAMTAAFKYALMQIFCIPTESTPDADAETHTDLTPVEAEPRKEWTELVALCKEHKVTKSQVEAFLAYFSKADGKEYKKLDDLSTEELIKVRRKIERTVKEAAKAAAEPAQEKTAE